MSGCPHGFGLGCGVCFEHEMAAVDQEIRRARSADLAGRTTADEPVPTPAEGGDHGEA